MDQQHVFESGGGRLENLSGVKGPFVQEAIANEFKLANRKNVAVANIGVVARCVKDSHALQGQILAERD
jgi:hypothetical protein